MATYQITGPAGEVYELDGPDNAPPPVDKARQLIASQSSQEAPSHHSATQPRTPAGHFDGPPAPAKAPATPKPQSPVGTNFTQAPGLSPEPNVFGPAPKAPSLPIAMPQTHLPTSKQMASSFVAAAKPTQHLTKAQIAAQNNADAIRRMQGEIAKDPYIARQPGFLVNVGPSTYHLVENFDSMIKSIPDAIQGGLEQYAQDVNDSTGFHSNTAEGRKKDVRESPEGQTYTNLVTGQGQMVAGPGSMINNGIEAAQQGKFGQFLKEVPAGIWNETTGNPAGQLVNILALVGAGRWGAATGARGLTALAEDMDAQAASATRAGNVKMASKYTSYAQQARNASTHLNNVAHPVEAALKGVANTAMKTPAGKAAIQRGAELTEPGVTGGQTRLDVKPTVTAGSRGGDPIVPVPPPVVSDPKRFTIASAERLGESVVGTNTFEDPLAKGVGQSYLEATPSEMSDAATRQVSPVHPAELATHTALSAAVSPPVKPTVVVGSRTGEVKRQVSPEDLVSTVPTVTGHGMTMGDIETAANKLGVQLPDKAAFQDTWADTRARAEAQFNDIRDSLGKDAKVVRPGDGHLSNEEFYVGHTQLRHLTEEAIPKLLKQIEVADDPATTAKLQGQLDAAMADADHLSNLLYKSGSSAGRRLAFQKAVITGPLDAAAILKKAQAVTGGKVSISAQTSIVRLTDKARMVQQNLRQTSLQRAEAALRSIENMDVSKLRAEALGGCK